MYILNTPWVNTRIGAEAPRLNHQEETETPSTYPPPYLTDDESYSSKLCSLTEGPPESKPCSLTKALRKQKNPDKRALRLRAAARPPRSLDYRDLLLTAEAKIHMSRILQKRRGEFQMENSFPQNILQGSI